MSVVTFWTLSLVGSAPVPIHANIQHKVKDR